MESNGKVFRDIFLLFLILLLLFMQHWKWVELKLIELGIINNPNFRLCFILDKSSMFRSGKNNEYIKPLHIIWSKFPRIWGKHNTLHIVSCPDAYIELNPCDTMV